MAPLGNARKSVRTYTLAASALTAVTLILTLGCQKPSTHRTALSDSPDALRPASAKGSAAVSLSARGDSGSLETIGLTDRLSVMSFNMEHRDRPKELAVMAKHLRSDMAETPDFLLLQEVVFARSRIAGEENTAAVLANELGYYSRGTQRTSDREGIAIVSRYPFLYYASRELSHQTSGLLLGFKRVSIMGEFNVPQIGRVRVVDVHLTNWDFDAHVRREQLEETLIWAGQRQKDAPCDLIVFGGDFNITADCDDLDMMYNTALSGGIDYRSYNNPRTNTRGGKRVDHIFVATPANRSNLSYINEQTMWRDGLTFSSTGSQFQLSDHLPVLQEFRVARGSGGGGSAAGATANALSNRSD
jgi:endonuclease/exonuclease/phosphatase family metal-dependent hydrolase